MDTVNKGETFGWFIHIKALLKQNTALFIIKNFYTAINLKLLDTSPTNFLLFKKKNFSIFLPAKSKFIINY